MTNVQMDAPEEARSKSLRIVGIGSSAGGLEALRALLQCLEPGTGCAFIVVQHLSPTYKSHLTELLDRETKLVVSEIANGDQLRADRVYITPPDCNVCVSDNTLLLQKGEQSVLPRPSVNYLLESIADTHGENTIAVILSGTGSDGAAGVRAIKAAGGFTFAQQPESARYDGMPSSAIETGCIDWVLSPAAIAAEITKLGRRDPNTTASLGLIVPELETQSSLRNLLVKVRSRTRLDFSGYKPATLSRRIERRMIATLSTSLPDYLAFTETHPDELEKLAKDVLISVTSFMRDGDAFTALENVIRELIGNKSPGDEIRVWVPGCATGEEAYSIAIMLHRILGTRFNEHPIQIFATDVDMDAMQIARRGRYPSSGVAHLGKDLVQRYFQPVNDAYEIIKTLRETVVFARQDLVLDPPFLRLDLISCRNLLIYLQPPVQSRILSLFHYALRPKALLFLGRSESVSQQDALFIPIDKEQRIFRRSSRSQPRLPSYGVEHADMGIRPAAASQHQSRQRELRLLQQAAQCFMPDCVLVDVNQQIRHVFGNAAGLLKVPSGKASLDLSAQLPVELRTETQSLLRRAVQTATVATSAQPLQTKSRGKQHPVRVSVRPFQFERGEEYFLVAFEPVQITTPVSGDTEHDGAQPDADDHHRQAGLEHELVAAREHLQTMCEELETSNEELQALSEELQAANEELQATNEELEASNEELQATNEELLTINDELASKSTELATTNADLELIQKNVGMPMLVVDENLCLLRFNSDASDLFRIHPGLHGAPLDRLAITAGMPGFADDVRQALAGQQPCERVIENANRSYLLRINLNFEAPGKAIGAIITLLDQTERHLAERDLRESQNRLEAVMRHSPIMVAIKDLTGRYTYANPPFRAFLGRQPHELISATDEKILPADVAEQLRAQELLTLRQRDALDSIEQIPAANGSLRRLQMIRFPMLDEDGNIQSLCIQALDVTARSEAEAQLRLAALVIDRAAEAVMVTDADKRIISVNKAFTAITGYAAEEAIGQTPAMLKSGRHDAAFYREMWRAINARGVWQGEIENLRKDGSLLIEWLTISVIHDDAGKVANYVALFSDISEIIDSRRKMEHLALHDELTSLPNRTLLLDRLKHALARAARIQTQVVLMFIDLDNFKDVNDSLGHESGDQLLIQLSVRLVSCVREQDTVARLGGDEFTVVLEDACPSEAEALAVRILHALNRPFTICGSEIFATASIGIAFFPDDGDDLNTLMQSADTAMYRAKSRGRNNFCYSTEDLRRHSVERLAIQNGLRQAFDTEELAMAFQPIFRVDDQQLAGCEALVRWTSPSLGKVGPATFVPIAEDSGQIIALTEWVVDAVLKQICRWRNRGIKPPRVAINFSPLHFRIRSIAEILIRKLAEFGLPADSVGVEITESAMSLAADQVSGSLLQLKELGVPVSLDDFGTGYSSLSRLSRLPIDTVKIDREFIDDLDKSDSNEGTELTRTIILMAHSLGMKALAEGVERQAQLDILKRLGCDYAQGHLLSEALSAEDVEVYFDTCNSVEG